MRPQGPAVLPGAGPEAGPSPGSDLDRLRDQLAGLRSLVRACFGPGAVDRRRAEAAWSELAPLRREIAELLAVDGPPAPAPCRRCEGEGARPDGSPCPGCSGTATQAAD